MLVFNLKSCNIRGLADKNKRRNFFHYLHVLKTDIAFLQETHSTRNQEKFWKSQWGGNILYSHGDSNARGVAILIAKGIDYNLHNCTKDVMGRYIILDITIFGNRYTLANCYAPNSDSPEFFQDFFSQINRINNIDKIIAGDLNTTLSEKDKNVAGYTHPKCTKLLNDTMLDGDLIDIWRVQHPNAKQFTWKRIKPRKLLERLDYILINNELCTKVKKSEISPSYNSDHSFPSLTLNLNTSHQNGYWKLNVAHLRDTSFCENIKYIIETCCSTYDDVFLRWEMIKMEVRGYALKFGARRKKSNNQQIRALTKKLGDLEKELSNTENSKLFTDTELQINKVKNDLGNLNNKVTEGAKLRCRVNWHDGGEKCTKYFLKMEKIKSQRKTISILNTELGQLTDENDILKEIRNHFAKLYKTQNLSILDLNDYILNMQIPQISKQDKSMLELPISIEEIKIAIKQMKKQKCPGLDGLPIEFYQVFLPQIIHTLHSLYMASIQKGRLNNSARQGVITLLEKPNRDLTKNFKLETSNYAML